MRCSKGTRTSKFLLATLLAALVADGIFGSGFFAAKPAQAQFVMPVIDAPGDAAGAASAVSNTTTATTQVKQSAWDVLKIALTNTAELAILNGANYFAQKLAYDTANYIAAGGKGQKPLFSWQGLEGEVKSASQDAAGEILGTLSSDPTTFGKYGVNLCAPSDPRAALNLQLGFLNGLPGIMGTAAPAAPKPKCTWDSISNNWDAFTQQDSSSILNNVGVMFTPGQSSLSAAIQVNDAAINLMNDKQKTAVDKFVANSGFKDLTDAISGKTKTPADTIKQQMNISQAEGWKQGDKTVAISGSAFANGAFGILTAAMQTFAGTLASKTLSKVFKQGLISLNDLLGNESDKTLSFDAAPTSGGRAAAELSNASLLTPKILSITNYNALTDFAACPQGITKNPNNCVMDGQFFAAVNRASQGSPMTVRQAVAQGFLNAGWSLLPLAHRKNFEPSCYNEAFCYSNLLKMRKAGVLPIGWELAANSPFNDVGRPVTLGEAMSRFDDCPRKSDGSVDDAKLPDSLHPWCHLIDPEWVLKYPIEVCRQQAPGPTLVSSDVAARAQICVDEQSCIVQDAAGNCVGGYGYCVREKNIWNLDADVCPAQYASCTAFKRTTDNASFSFLSNTLDAGACNSQNAGCRQYSQSSNSVANPSFEDVLNGAPRDWTLPAGAKFDRSGLHAEQGNASVGVVSGQIARGKVYSLLPGTLYTLSGSVLQENSGANLPVGTLKLLFYKPDGTPIVDANIKTTCAYNAGDPSVTLGVSASHLGYLSGRCDLTTPPDATSAAIELTSNVGAGNRTFFDDIGLFSDGTYSASPYDSLLLNGSVEKCASDQAGCTDLIRLSTATLNLLRNPSFETADTAGKPAFWTLTDPTTYEHETQKGSDGISAIKLSPTGVSQDARGLLASAAYAFSVASKLDGGTVDQPRAVIQLYDSSVPPVPVAPTTFDGCTLSGTAMRLDLASGADYARSVCTFTTPLDIGFARVTMLDGSGSTALVDAAQLELSVQATDFHDGYSQTAQHAYLKTAPAGLNCSGPNPPPACAAFAASCRRDEVGCESYDPVAGGALIPAVTAAGDACPTECVGYDTFTERSSNFNDGRFPLFLIPTTAQTCTASEDGCSEFTNVQKLASGGEAREYYSYLRLCVKPDANAGTFYTWEGNDTQGYQLRTWSLLKSDVADAPAGVSDPTGGNAPCTKVSYDASARPFCADTAASLADASCSKSGLQLDPDCREFYDIAGNIHYRKYSKTIVISDACTEYRITKSSAAECAAHGGFMKAGECHYLGFTPESSSCRATANGCRAYAGNASANVRVAMSDDFEGGNASDWAADAPAAAVNSDESVTAGGHSLKISAPSGTPKIAKDVSQTIHQGKAYLLNFWAKGNGDLSIAFSGAGDKPFTYNRLADAPAPIGLTTEWKAYQVGPVTVVNAPASDERLTITLSGSSAPLYFIDNIELREITGDLYLISDSWKTPDSCDQTPTGASSPQYMLGCRAYRTHLNTTVSLKSFDRLCRPEAVGCEALYDTRHTESPFPQTFGAICSIASACSPSPGATTCPCVMAGQAVCNVTARATSCRYDVDDEVPATQVSPQGDTVRIPSDGIDYLVNDAAHRCDQANVGCTAMGDKTLTRERDAVQSWSTVTLMNDPAKYADILCKKSEEFCQAYTRNVDGSSAYFKEPDLRTCEYKEGVTGYSGWFKTGTEEPCYANYLQAGTQYGIWKNSDTAYDSWVGQCPSSLDQCKEFIDPQDTSPGHPNGQPYYAIKNDRLDATTCQNQASLTTSPTGADSASACVLFWQTDNLLKTFDASATYELSKAKNGALVQAVSDAGNDTNVAIRVARDRQCGEWLDCRSSEAVFNPSNGQYQNVCLSYSLCAEYQTVGNTTQCIRYVDSDYAGGTLTSKVYQSRDTGWKGLEYTSYAIPNQYPVNELVTMNVGSDAKAPDLRLVRIQGACSGPYGAKCGPTADQGTCLGPIGSMKCVYPIDDGFKVAGAGAETQLKQAQAKTGYPDTSCRAYPDENAPFPSSVADPNGWNLGAAELNAGDPVLIGPSPAYAHANVCQRHIVNGVEVSDCECNYTQTKYGSMTKYFGSNDSDLPLGFCSGGAYDGYSCDPLATDTRTKDNLSCCTKPGDDSSAFGSVLGGSQGCDDGAQCTRLSKVDRVVGYEGQCLERDFTTPINGRNDEYACLTWRPVGLVGGSRDIYNQNQTAGYFAAADRRFYCVGQQVPWAVKFEIQAEGSDNHPDLTNTTACNGHVCGPSDQDPNNYFGHGVVTNGNPSHVLSQDVTCEDNDSVPGGDWCVWPTDVTGSYAVQTTGGGGAGGSKPVLCNGTEGKTGNPCASGYMCHYNIGDTVGKCVTQNLQYHIDSDAIGILGCYEVADAGTYKETFIDYPYTGPPLYRQQLQSIYFQMTNDIYRDGDRGNRANNPTNPQNKVEDDCNDDGDDSLIDPNGDSHAPITDNDVTPTEILDGKVVSSGRNKGLRYMEESNSWSVDVSNGGGTVVLKATFDKNGLLKSVRVAADDHNDSGTFGINRMGFVFKPGCQEVAQVDQNGEFGATKAFTNEVNPYRDFTGGTEATVGMHDTLDQPWQYPNACLPFGTIGSIASQPPTKPWTYVAARTQDDLQQCSVTDYVKGASYLAQAPEWLSAEVQGNPSGFPSSAANWAATSIRNLFRQLFGVWQYNKLSEKGGGGSYSTVAPDTTVTDQSGSGAYDETSVVDASSLAFRTGLGAIFGRAWNPPRIAAVDASTCDANGHCKAGQLDDMTINGRQKGIVLGAGGAMNVTAKFYAWASHNAMPIAQRTLLWGDYTLPEPPAKGWYKNQKPYCSPDTSDTNAIGECDNASGLTCNDNSDCPGSSTCTKGTNSFGNVPGACNPVPYQFDHVYTCSLKDLQAMPVCTGAPEAADNAPCYRMSGGAPTCVYRPKAQVTDNWGWCNCTGSACASPNKDGAYQQGCNTTNPPANAKPWSEFAGEIRLGASIEDARAFVPGSGGGGGGGGGGPFLGGTAVDDHYTTNLRQVIVDFSSGVLTNDTLVGAVATRQVVAVSLPTFGALFPSTNQMSSTGGFSYQANNGFHGTDTFTYKIVQDGNDSNVATVFLTTP